MPNGCSAIVRSAPSLSGALLAAAERDLDREDADDGVEHALGDEAGPAEPLDPRAPAGAAALGCDRPRAHPVVVSTPAALQASARPAAVAATTRACAEHSSSSPSSRSLAPGSALARECGIPDSNPLWVDFAGHDAPLPQKPGLTLAFTSGTVKPAEARANGAATVFFDLNFNNRVGTPTMPTDPATMVDRADRLFDFAVTRHRLPDAVDRAERALRRADADAVDDDDGAVPREHARCSCAG